MSLLDDLHQAHKARQARIAMKAVVPTPVPEPVAEPKKVLAPVDPTIEWIERQKKIPIARDMVLWSPEMDIDLPDKEGNPPRIEAIQRACCRHFGITRTDILSPRRTAVVVRPRQVAMYLARTLTTRSMPEIGRRFGNRDHTTVLSAVRKMERLVAADPALASQVETIKAELVA